MEHQPRGGLAALFSNGTVQSSTDLDSPGSSTSSPVRMTATSVRTSIEVDPLEKLMRNNKAWSAARLAEDAGYFNRLCLQQAPEYLWIGCSDSRVPANSILGLEPGEVFVQRNVGNQATHTDLNGMSCLEYAVKELKVRNVIVCGHYGCGAVKAALKMPSKTQNLVNCWISDIRECRNMHRAELMALPDLQAQVDRLTELNVLRQTFNVCTTSVVQSAWDKGQHLNIYGVVYSLNDGLMKKVCGPISKSGDFVHDQTTFATSGISYVGSAGKLSEMGGNHANADRNVPMAASYKARMDAFNAYVNTVQVNNRIAEHVGWTEDSSATAATNAAAAAAEAAAAVAVAAETESAAVVPGCIAVSANE